MTVPGYYKWIKSKNKENKHSKLLANIKAIRSSYKENENYGFQRIYLELQRHYGYKGSKSTIYRVCKNNGLLIPRKRKPNSLTKADMKAQKSENLIKQNFSANTPNEKWLSDITEVPCMDGKLYVSAIMDCYDGAIVGLSMSDNMKKELCIETFEQACTRYNASGMVFHTDRGSQYTSRSFRECLEKKEAIQSMSCVGRCYDNARMESFFATLKKEKLYKLNTKFLRKEEVKTIIFRYIEIYYNRRRVYTSNPRGYAPLEFRELYYSSMYGRVA